MFITKVMFYENRQDVFLTTYIQEESEELQQGKKRPAVLICPGGAYMNCSDREAEPVALRFASMGYQAFVLRYSTYMEGKGGFPDLAKPLELKPERSYPVPFQEIGRAMLLIRDHSEEWLVDPEKIVLCGFSAGAHNCAMYATHWSKPVIIEKFGRPAKDLRPAACILGYCLSDYLFMKENNEKDPFAKMFFRASNTAYLGSTEPSEQQLLMASPAKNVDADTPQMFLWATADDNLVPVQNTLLMAKALSDHEIPYEAHIFENGPHGLSLATQATAGNLKEVNQSVRTWVSFTEAWMERHFPLELPKEPV